MLRIEIPEGKNLDRAIEKARAEAKKRGVEVWITRTFTVREQVRSKPILHISPQGNLSEMVSNPMRVTIAERVMAQVVREADDAGEVNLTSPTARILTAFVERGKEKRAA